MWLIPSSIRSRSALASECLTLDSMPDLSILESRAEQLPMRNGMPMPPRSLLRSWKQDVWMRRLCGAAIWQDSTANHFVAASMPLSAASHASRSALPESVKASTTSAPSGPPLQNLCATLEHGLWHSKTCQESLLLEDSTRLPVTWPRSGSMRNGRCYQRERLELHTDGSGFSLSESSDSTAWPTPDTNPYGRHNTSPGPAGARPTIALAAKEWRTPDTNECGGAQDAEKRLAGGHSLRLQDQAHSWPMPDANADSYRLKGNSQQSKSLEPITRAWASPTARIWKGGGNAMTRKDGKSRMDMLDWQAESLHRGQPINDGPQSSESGQTLPRRLNPAFAAWLMGWPSWWTNPGVTSCAASEMASYRSQLRQQLSDLCGD